MSLVPRKRPVSVSVLAVLGLVLLSGLAWHLFFRGASAQDQQARGQGRAFKTVVTVAPASRKDVDLFLSGLGSVAPLNTVNVKSRVEGHLMEVRFQEGQMVAEGDLLAVIDARPFQAQLEQARGQMARDKAQLENARKDLERYKGLIGSGAIARQQLDTQESLVRQHLGAAQADQGQIDTARLQIAYSRITAPIAGRVGLRQVDPGNMIQGSNQTIAVITQMQPIAVVFTIPEDSLPRVLARMRQGQAIPVDAYDREQKHRLARGELLTVDNQIDPATGTVKLKARFANQDWTLYPNQFVNARILMETLPGALVVPAQAVQRGPQGAMVYVAAQGVAQSRQVEAGETVDGLTVIRSGLVEGESVVLEGAERLRDGAAIEIKGEDSGQSGAGKRENAGTRQGG